MESRQQDAHDRHRSRWMRAATAVLAALVTVPATPQAPDDDSDTPFDTEIRETVEVRIMELSLVAVNAAGMPVTDLKPGDLEVRSRGDTLEIAYLDATFTSPAEVDPPPDAKLHLKIRKDYETAATTPTEPRYYIFFVDVENNDLVARPDEMESMQDFVDEGMQDHDLAAVLGYNGRLDLLQPFTGNREILKDGIRRAFETPRRPTLTLFRRVEELIGKAEMCYEIAREANEGGEVSSSAATGRTADEECLRGVATEYEQENRRLAEDFLKALEATVRLGGGLNGRATVFAYSHGASVDPYSELLEAFEAVYGTDAQSMDLSMDYDSLSRTILDRVLTTAAQERVSLHFIDTTVEPVGQLSVRRSGIMAPTATPLEAAYTAPQTNLRQIAAATGGSFWETQDALDGLRRALDTERGRYTLGISLESMPDRDKLPRVRVTTRRQGVEIVVGKSVRPRPATSGTIDGRITPGDAIRLPDDSATLLPFLLGFKLGDLDYESADRKTDRIVANLSLHVALQTVTGRHIASSYHWIEHAYSPAERGDGSDVLAFKGGVEGPPGDYRLVAYVRNVKTGRAGWIVREMRIPESAPEAQPAG